MNALQLKFNERTVCYAPLFSSLKITVNYTHSVSLTKVVDVYTVNDSGIFAVQERWQQFDAGQPLETHVENGFFVKNMRMYLGRSWEYWFIPLNNVTVKLDGKIVFSGPDEDGILEFGLVRDPFIVIASRWC